MESVLLVAPITALEFVGDHLLAGEGPNLTVYSLKSSIETRPRIQQNVLGGYTIHGIKPTTTSLSQDTWQLCVFGSKGLTVLKLCLANQQIELSQVCCLQLVHDWIWDIQWLHKDPKELAYLGLALGHNSVALYDYISGKVLKEVHCAEKCILYSAHFVGKTWEELTLISGTVFNQLVIWGMCDQTNKEGRVEPRRRISGHKGVIFSIFYEKVKGILASASDDRSLRVWKVGDLTDSESDIQCLLVLYGHQSRVWSVKLLQENIVSIGEDSTCIVWTYAGDIVHNFKGHKGRGIRAVTVQEQLGWVVTGGADSGIRLWQIKGRSPLSSGLVNLNFHSPERIGTPKAIAMVDTNCLLVMTDEGSIYMYDLIGKQWAFVLADENYRSYSLLDVITFSTNVLCAIGSIAGGVKIFSLPFNGSFPELKLYDGKVHSLTWVSSPCSTPDKCHLFSSGPNGVMIWHEVKCVSGHIKSISEKCRFNLPACKQRWHTCIAFVPSENVIVCGDRRGSLMLFSVMVAGVCDSTNARSTFTTNDCLQSTSSVNSDALDSCLFPSVSSPPEKPEDPVFVLYGIHGKLGVTSVTWHDGFVYSTGRDGLYRQLNVEGARLIVLRKLRACKGMEWIECLSFMPDGNLNILGFHSTDFVVWSMKTNEKFYCVPCGGGHRSWSYKNEEPKEVFAYIKSGDIFAYQGQPARKFQSVLKEPLHGRELTCIRYAGKVRHKEKDIHILITSSEDTTVTILAFNEVSKEISQLAIINDHLSSVKTMALAKTQSSPSKNGILSCILFTAGGRAQIECYQLLVQEKEDIDRITCQVIHLASHRLDEQWDKMKNKHRVIKVDPETRYMSIQALNDVLGQCCLFLAAACSDGSVRIFMMCEDLQRMILVAETFYHQRCVLKVETFAHQSGDSVRVWLCSASTDGQIAFWDITSTVECAYKMLHSEYVDGQPRDLGLPCSTFSVHQCGINSLQIRKRIEGHYLLASGGDDNSIHVCKLALHSKSENRQMGSVDLLQSFSISSAHAAHVTGLRILRQDLLVSASVDQRLTLWSLSADGLQQLATKFCHVADVSELDFWQSGDGDHWCVLCGQGLEIIVYKPSK